jgi:hypothetical protein
LKYEKNKEDERVARTMFIYDKFGNEIPGAISYDTDTGIVVVHEPENGPGGKGRLINMEKYHPGGMCIVDNIARPDEKQLGDVRHKHTGKRERS